MTETEDFAEKNNLVLNKKKTKVMKFTNSRKLDFPPEITFRDGTHLETMRETTLLGVIVSDDLKWGKNTEHICNKARRKLWILRRMLCLKLTIFEMFDVYTKEIRSILEFAVPVWHSSLTRKQVSEIEFVQKLAFKIILGRAYSSYSDACARLQTVTLEERRLAICLRFASKNIKSDKCLFTKPNEHFRLRRRNHVVKEYKCNKAKFQRSSLPYLAKLANSAAA